jgi:hypothetical protein
MGRPLAEGIVGERHADARINRARLRARAGVLLPCSVSGQRRVHPADEAVKFRHETLQERNGYDIDEGQT